MSIPKDFIARFYLEGTEAPNLKIRQVLIGDFVRKLEILEKKLEPLFDNWRKEYNSINEIPGNIYNPDYCKFMIEKMKPYIEDINSLPGRVNIAIEVRETFDIYGVVKNNDKIHIRFHEKEEE